MKSPGKEKREPIFLFRVLKVPLKPPEEERCDFVFALRARGEKVHLAEYAPYTTENITPEVAVEMDNLGLDERYNRALKAS